jgi:hypothetical protein
MHHHHNLDDVHYDVAVHDQYPTPHHHEYHPDDIFITVDHIHDPDDIFDTAAGNHLVDYLRAYRSTFADVDGGADAAPIGSGGYDVTYRTA